MIANQIEQIARAFRSDAISRAAEHGMVRLCHIAAAMSQLPEIMAILVVVGSSGGERAEEVRPAVLVSPNCTRQRSETIKRNLTF